MLTWQSRSETKGLFAIGNKAEYWLRVVSGRRCHRRSYTLHSRASLSGPWDHLGIFDTRPQAKVRAEQKETGSLLEALLSAGRESAEGLRARITDVRYGPAEGSHENILFSFDGTPWRAELRGRNADLMLTESVEGDRAVALRAMLDGDASAIRT